MKIRGLAAIAVMAGLAGACSLAVGLDDITIKGQGGGGGAGGCKVAADCDDHDPCTADACGAAGTCTHTLDDTAIPDDLRDCTIDACSHGEASHTPKPEGTACDKAGATGSCDAMGACVVECVTAGDCPDPGPCKTASCDGTHGVCAPVALPENMETPGVTQTPGDCHVHACVMGADVDQNDDTDVPKTVTDCDDEVCTAGVPSNPPRLLGSPCSTYLGSHAGFCAGATPSPSCRQCAADTDCPGVITDCQHPTCVAFACVTANTPAGTPTTGNPAQMTGDCGRLECDGNGGTTTVLDTTDPQDDGIACTKDTCSAVNATVHTTLPDGTVCGVGGALACVGGMCAGCTTSAMCNPASCAGTMLTKAQTCNGSGACVGTTTQDCAPYLCSAGTNGCTSTCPNSDAGCSQAGVGNYCTGPSGMCLPKLAQGAACSAGDHQCQSGHCVDGVCCNIPCGGTCMACTGGKTGGSNGVCAAITSGTDPDAECADLGASSCGTNGVCANGACALYPNGTPCTAPTCTGSTTLVKPHVCSGGTCGLASPATVPCAPYVCSGVACTSTCAVDTDCASGDYCSGSACLIKQPLGAPCAGPNQCGSGFCADGVCCNNACNAACQACSAAKKASGAGTGTCGAAKVGVDPRALCAVTAPASCGTDGTCNGASMGLGACADWSTSTVCAPQMCFGNQLAQSKTCNGVGSCSLGGNVSQCVGGLVCNTPAKSCYLTCGLGAAADDTRCVAGDYCDGTVGICKVKVGAGGPCSAGNQCAGGICGGNVCCVAACANQGAASCGTDGTCQAGTGACNDYPSGTSCSATACSGGMLSVYTMCDGVGACSQGSSGPCMGGFACASGTACLTACGTDDGSCQSMFYCDGVGAGACQPKQMPGASCVQDHECVDGFCFLNQCN